MQGRVLQGRHRLSTHPPLTQISLQCRAPLGVLSSSPSVHQRSSKRVAVESRMRPEHRRACHHSAADFPRQGSPRSNIAFIRKYPVVGTVDEDLVELSAYSR